MLTRLQVSGFKNLVNVDVRFGPFTCVVGPNGAGKSNLFDAIRFLQTLAGGTLMEAAASVRDQDSRTADVRNLIPSSRRSSCRTDVLHRRDDRAGKGGGRSGAGGPGQHHVPPLC